MALQRLGYIELPDHINQGGFDHADIHACKGMPSGLQILLNSFKKTVGCSIMKNMSSEITTSAIPDPTPLSYPFAKKN
jgi:hypothetical protein